MAQKVTDCAESFLWSLLLLLLHVSYNGFNMAKIVSMFTNDNTDNDVFVH